MTRLGTFLLLIGFIASNTAHGMGGKSPFPSSPPTDTTTIQPHYDRFKQLGQLYGARFIASTVTFSFTAFFGATVGMCSFNSGGRNHVALSNSAWGSGSETFREMLLFHELGHCLLGRGHKNTTHSDGRPESLMRSSMFSQTTYNNHRDQYLKELFTASAQVSSRLMLGLKEGEDDDGGPCTFGRR